MELMAGKMDAREAWKKASALTLYVRFQEFRHGKYRGDAAAYVKRNGVSAYCTLNYA